jgi:hypothetical protein
VYCPVCKNELSGDVQNCYICGYDLQDNSEENEEWVMLGIIDDKIHADLGQEALKSCNIPAVVFSKSGFFGNIGLFLNPFHSDASAAFEIVVPKEFAEEAAETLDMTLGEKWHRKE